MPQKLSWSSAGMAFTQPFCALQLSGGSVDLCPINFEEFKTGYGIFTFDLSESGDGERGPPRNGVVKLLAEFTTAPTTPLMFLLMLEIDRTMHVDKKHNVSLH
jgi:hypothetical protein